MTTVAVVRTEEVKRVADRDRVALALLIGKAALATWRAVVTGTGAAAGAGAWIWPSAIWEMGVMVVVDEDDGSCVGIAVVVAVVVAEDDEADEEEADEEEAPKAGLLMPN